MTDQSPLSHDEATRRSLVLIGLGAAITTVSAFFKVVVASTVSLRDFYHYG